MNMQSHNSVEAEYNGRIDESLFELQQLLSQGYITVTWVNKEAACERCQTLNGQEWNLSDFIAQTQYSAPIFSKSHVQCLCYIEVKHENGTIVRLDYTGVI